MSPRAFNNDGPGPSGHDGAHDTPHDDESYDGTEWGDGDEEEEPGPQGRGWTFFFIALVLSLGVIGGGIYALNETLDRGYLDQFNYIFKDVNLMPSDPLTLNTTENSIKIYLSRDAVSLTPFVKRLRRESPGPEKARLILQELFSAQPQAMLRSPLPEGTRSRAFYQVGRVAYLDLTREFLNPAHPTPRGERLAIYCIVDSIVLNVPEIDALQILVEGRPIESAWGWLDCSSPLGADLSLIQ